MNILFLYGFATRLVRLLSIKTIRNIRLKSSASKGPCIILRTHYEYRFRFEPRRRVPPRVLPRRRDVARGWEPPRVAGLPAAGGRPARRARGSGGPPARSARAPGVRPGPAAGSHHLPPALVHRSVYSL